MPRTTEQIRKELGPDEIFTEPEDSNLETEQTAHRIIGQIASLAQAILGALSPNGKENGNGSKPLQS